jgi:hypothetical protein
LESREDGGDAYLGVLAWKNERMDNCAGGALAVGRDMVGVGEQNDGLESNWKDEIRGRGKRQCGRYWLGPETETV